MEKQSTARGFSFLGVAGITSKLLAVLYVPVLTLILGNIGNGIYNAGYMMYLLVFVITNSGVPVAISKLVSEQIALSDYEASYKTLKVSGTVLLLTGTLTSILTAVFAKEFAAIIKWPEAYMTILALSPTMFFTAISCTFRGYFQGRSNMKPTSISQVIEQAVNSILTIAFAYIMFYYGANHAVLAGIINPDEIKLEAVKYAAAGGTVGTSVGALVSAIYLSITFFSSKAHIKDEMHLYQTDKNSKYTLGFILRKIFEYAVPITIGQIAIYSAGLVDLRFIKERLIVGGFGVNEASALFGVFSTQYQKVLFIPLALATALSVAIIPAISSAAAIGDRKLLRKKIVGSLKTILMITVPAAIGMAVFADPIIRIIFPGNPQGADLLMMGSWVLIPIAFVSTQTAILQAIGKTYLPTKHMIMGLVIKIFINYNLVAIGFINIKGAVLGSGFCFLFTGYLNYRAIKKATGFNVKYNSLIRRPLSVSVLMGIISWFAYKGVYIISGYVLKGDYIHIAVSGFVGIFVGALSYFVLMIMTSGIKAEDILAFPKGYKILNFANKFPMLKKKLTISVE